MQVVRGALAEITLLPFEQGVRRLVVAAVEGHRVDPDLHRVLAEQILRTGRLGNVGMFNREPYALFKAWLEAHRHELRVADLELAAFICGTSIEALTHNAVLHRADMLTDEAVATLIDETTRLVVGYLR